MKKLTKAQAASVYEVLIQDAGASSDEFDKENFAAEFSGNNPTNEWRFRGSLGFGGKFRFPRMCIDCYPEDETPDRLAVISKVNEKLASLQKNFGLNL